MIPFSLTNSLPVFAITPTEGLEASLVLAAVGTFNIEWSAVGATAILAVVVAISAISYEYLLRVPRWALDLLAGTILIVLGSFSVLGGVLSLI